MKRLSNQNGAVLITSLIFLLIMTLLALSSMQNTSLEEKMAGNVRAQNIAFQAAEAALRGGEAYLQGLTIRPTAVTNGPVWPLYDLDEIDSLSAFTTWWQDWSETNWENNAVSLTELTGVTAPHYVIEEVALVPFSLNTGSNGDGVGVNYYQITSRGSDLSGNVRVILRSTLSRRF
ncbi:MAG: pilus assembly protein PilZ [Gammaproteobacteria bacterium]|nr:pilus assembly protein PilZ [Gammaproteobacteria bacterium]